MRLDSWQDWVAWAGIVIPLASLAWAACFYVLARRAEIKQQEFERVFRAMDLLGQAGGSIASKMAAAYELRKYTKYAPVIVRLCERVQVEGPSASMLQNELALTAEEMRHHL